MTRRVSGAKSVGVLAQLRADKRGNTLAMAAISLVPMSAMIGSGLDMGRTYLVKARLQSACDAGALAARRVMDGSATLTGAANTAGQNFFNNNFPAGTYGSSNLSFSATLDSEKQVIGTAAARVPMTLMKMFNYQNMDVTATCSARLDITNTDVMFVLDVTGSMACSPSGGSCNSGSSSKIQGLRDAVMDFYATLSGSAPATAQIRYGFVPYSAGMNVADVITPSRIVDSWQYQSRVALMDTPVYIASMSSPSIAFQTYPNPISSQACNQYGSNESWPTSSNGSVTYDNVAPNPTNRFWVSFEKWTKTGTANGTDVGTCIRERQTRTLSYETKYRFSRWIYKPVTYDVSNWKTGGSITLATNNPGTGTNNNYLVDNAGEYRIDDLPGRAGTRGTSWNSTVQAYFNSTNQNFNGSTATYNYDNCIEERDTVPNATFTYGSLPANAWDLDIDTAPSSPETTWRPTFNGAVYRTDGNRPGYVCPAAAQRLATMSAADVQSYVDGLVATGSTWHDLGMAWGARLMSPTGLFAADNTSAPNGQPITRNIIFMTDGAMNADEWAYGGWGFEVLDKRTSDGDFNSMDNRHNSRFVALCNAARAKNIRMWVVGFGTALNTELTQCADPGQAFQASNTATLRAQFAAIASKIAKLRLSQ